METECFRTFDILLLKAERLDTQLGALSRLKSWLAILSKVRICGPSPGFGLTRAERDAGT